MPQRYNLAAMTFGFCFQIIRKDYKFFITGPYNEAFERGREIGFMNEGCAVKLSGYRVALWASAVLALKQFVGQGGRKRVRQDGPRLVLT